MARKRRKASSVGKMLVSTGAVTRVQLYVHMLETCHNESAKFPVLIALQPADNTLKVADITLVVKLQDHPAIKLPDGSATSITPPSEASYSLLPSPVPGYDYIGWISPADLHDPSSDPYAYDYTLHVEARVDPHKGTYDSNHHFCRVLNPKSVPASLLTGRAYSTSNPPTIVSPLSGAKVGTSFTAYGYDNPPTTQVTGWVTIGTTTYPGTTLASPQPPYNWAVSFSGLQGQPSPGAQATICVQINGTNQETAETIYIVS